MFKTTLKFFIFIALVWLGLLATLPFYFSTDYGQKYALNIMEEKSGHTIAAESISISWLGPQLIKNVRYESEKTPIRLTSNTVEIDNSLITLLLPGNSTVKGRAKGLNVKIDTGKETNLKFVNAEASFLLEANLHHKKLNELELQLVSNQGKFSIFGVNYDGRLLLRKPLEAAIAVNSDLGKKLLRSLFPYLDETVNAEKSISLSISPEGFSVPLALSGKDARKIINVSELKIAQGKIDLGVLSFKNLGPIAKILDILESKKTNELQLWFTPAYFSVANGVVHLQRTDMLAMGSYPLAIWGEINLPEEQLNLTLGIPLKAFAAFAPITELSKTFGSNMLLLPLKGSFSDNQIDTQAVKAKLGLLAVKFLGGLNKLIKGNEKKISEAVKNVDLSKDFIPEPTTQPLPWEKRPGEKK